MKIACISDCHEQWQDVVIPECDLLISAGDYSYRGDRTIVRTYHTWLAQQRAKHIISLQGNHELWVEANFREALDIVTAIDRRIHFVAHDAIEIEGIKIYCSAVTPAFNDWAWNVERGEDIAKHWASIPDDTEILVTHGPARGILDGDNLGCVDLTERITELDNLKLHVFGHIHGASGEIVLNKVKHVNAAICDEKYKPTNPVRMVELC